MTTLREAALRALEACEQRLPLQGQAAIIDELNDLRAALAEPVQEPATLPGPGLVMCPACCAQFDPALNSVQPVQEPVAWTLTRTLTERKTTTNGYLWFSDPVNSSWTPLYTAPPQRSAQPVQEPVAREQVLAKHIEFQKAETQRYFELYNGACETAKLRLKEIARLESRLAALAAPGSDYERGFVDGMLEQARRSVDKAVNAMAEPIIKPEIKADKPFGYFRAEPFGWTDCAPTDEGAIPLYDRPQAQQFLYNAWADEQIQKEKK